ncbi:MAG: sodium:proton antiporter, partial [Flavobacterium sp.]
MTTYTTLIILSGLVIFSYLFDLVASKTKLPSVLLLLFSGIGLRLLVDNFNIQTFNFLTILPTLGT